MLGKDARMYRNSGTHAAPTWEEIIEAKDVNVPLTMTEADVTARDSGGVRMTEAAILEASIDFGIFYVQGNANFDALRAAFFARTPIQFAVMSGDITVSGNEGLRAFCKIFDFSEDQALEEGVMFNVSLKPTRFLEAGALVVPDWYVVP